ncbi:peptidase [Helicobacter enhydrae]|uniref:Peptidase n=2 Tax=Helicobacter enhydrae TaxID=222136 RepID=A0A1B1U7K5_9HELI|nr:peptidase [Helicobacter enhydrae]
MFSLLCLLSANTIHADDFATQNLLKIVNDYRQARLDRVDQNIQELLEQKEYWINALSLQDTQFGYYEKIEYIFVSNKSKPDLSLYRFDYGKLTQIGESDALVGSGSGEKKTSGDLTTPLGVYDLTNKLTKLDQYYGPMAFVTSYPNAYDKSLKRTGYGIWIHGMPLNGNRDELNTKGCIAIENEIIKKYEKYINPDQTILIVYENTYTPPSNQELASILSELYRWKNAWQKNDYERYMSFYSPDFRKSNGTNYEKYAKYKARIFAKKESKSIRLLNINVIPYPNEDNEKIFRITFEQKYNAYKKDKLSYSSDSQKEIYLTLKPNGKIAILLEE